LLSFGGSGSLFTPDIAHAIGAPQVIVPELASVLSAFGAATADVRRERLRSVLATAPVDPTIVEKLAEELTRIVDADLDADGVVPEDRRVEFEADLRFAKQSVELTIPVPAGPLPAALHQLVDDFRDEYAKRFGRGSIVLGTPIEMVSLRAVGVGATTKAALGDGSAPPVPQGTAAPVAGTRAVRLARGDDGLRDVHVYDVDALAPGHVLVGPALIDGSDTTVWVPDGTTARVDALGSLVIDIGAAGEVLA